MHSVYYIILNNLFYECNNYNMNLAPELVLEIRGTKPLAMATFVQDTEQESNVSI